MIKKTDSTSTRRSLQQQLGGHSHSGDFKVSVEKSKRSGFIHHILRCKVCSFLNRKLLNMGKLKQNRFSDFYPEEKNLHQLEGKKVSVLQRL